jgi:hypothetical protein
MRLEETHKLPLARGVEIYREIIIGQKLLFSISVLSLIGIFMLVENHLTQQSIYPSLSGALKIRMNHSLQKQNIRPFGEAAYYGPHLEEVGTYRFTKINSGFGLESFEFTNTPKSYVEERLLLSLPRVLRWRARPYVKPVLKIAEKYQVDPVWVLSIMWTESHFKVRAKSKVGAAGLMQIMPKTKIYLKSVLKRKKIRLEAKKDLTTFFAAVPKGEHLFYRNKLENIELGIFYLKNAA